MLTGSEAVLTVASCAAEDAAAEAGVLTVSEGVLTVAAGAVPPGAAEVAGGVLIVSAGVLTVAAGAAAAAGGMLTVSEDVLTLAAVAAADAAQCSEIMFTSVTARLFSAVAALCPMRFTSWPRWALRSALLVVILKILPVLSSATV